ncbi:unnamed protein product [Malus baccata var. baccata]
MAAEAAPPDSDSELDKFRGFFPLNAALEGVVPLLSLVQISELQFRRYGSPKKDEKSELGFGFTLYLQFRTKGSESEVRIVSWVLYHIFCFGRKVPFFSSTETLAVIVR